MYIPDNEPEEQALARTTHLCLAAHQDDIEIMAAQPIIECFQQKDKWFTGVVVTDGRGSPRDGMPSDPPYPSCDVSLHAAVPTMPGVEKPSGEAAGSARIFELRTYRSATEAASRRKIEMFEAGGELALFARLGLNVVFFARDLVAGGLPSLTYMVVFADGAAREKAWAAFGSHPEWVKMRDDPRYAQTVSTIDSALLRPTEYSQL